MNIDCRTELSHHSEVPAPRGFYGVLAGATGLEPAASGVTGRRSNQLSYAPGKALIFGLSLRVRWDTTRIPPSQDRLESPVDSQQVAHPDSWPLHFHVVI